MTKDSHLNSFEFIRMVVVAVVDAATSRKFTPHLAAYTLQQATDPPAYVNASDQSQGRSIILPPKHCATPFTSYKFVLFINIIITN